MAGRSRPILETTPTAIGSDMQTVEIHIPPSDLPQQMAAMRNWLDEHRFEPKTFACDETAEALRLCVTFGESEAATAFAARFEGRVQPRSEIAIDGTLPATGMVG
jgi:hypothetical protein